EHLLLGLLREKDCFAARILAERGADFPALRTRIGKQVTQPFDPNAFAIPPSARAGETITIHDVPRNSLTIREAVKRSRVFLALAEARFNYPRYRGQPQDRSDFFRAESGHGGPYHFRSHQARMEEERSLRGLPLGAVRIDRRRHARHRLHQRPRVAV